MKTLIVKKNTAYEVNHTFRRPTGDAPTITGTPTYSLRQTGVQVDSGNMTADAGTKYYVADTAPNAEGTYVLYVTVTADGLTCEEEIATLIVVDEDLATLVDSVDALQTGVNVTTIEGSDATDQIATSVLNGTISQPTNISDAKSSAGKALYGLLMRPYNKSVDAGNAFTVYKDGGTAAFATQTWATGTRGEAS